MWAAIRLKCEAAVLKFIAHGANVRALERVDEPIDRRYGNNPEGEEEEDDDDRPPVQHPMLQIAEGFTAWLSRISAPKPKEPHIPPYRRDPHQPPVMGAASVGHVGIMEILLAHGANPDARDFCSWVPLMTAAVSKHEEMVMLLLGLGVALNAYGGFRNCALSIASEFGVTRIIKILLAHPQINPDPCFRHQREQGTRNDSPLICAIQSQHTDIVKLILDKGVDPRVIDERSEASALCMAAETGNLVILRMLLEKGAGEDLPSRDHFYRGARRYHAKVVQCLRERGINSNTEVKDEQTVDIEMVNYITRRRDKPRRWMRRRRGIPKSNSDDEVSDRGSD